MDKKVDEKPGDARGAESGFLTRWSARKRQIAQGLDVPEEVSDDKAIAANHESSGIIENEEDASLSDSELLKKYKVPDPAEIEEEAGLDRFFDGQMPERLRQMALRRLWRINPFFGFVDEMVEYGEDYTDAATVIDGMQTAYQAGKGYVQKVLEKGEEDKYPPGSVSESEESLPNDKRLRSSEEKSHDGGQNDDNDVRNTSATADETDPKISDNRSSRENVSEITRDSDELGSSEHSQDKLSQHNNSVVVNNEKYLVEASAKNIQKTKPRRMQFRVNSER